MQKVICQEYFEDQPNPSYFKLLFSGAFVWIISRMQDTPKNAKQFWANCFLKFFERKESFIKLACKLVDTYTDSSMCYSNRPVNKTLNKNTHSVVRQRSNQMYVGDATLRVNQQLISYQKSIGILF